MRFDDSTRSRQTRVLNKCEIKICANDVDTPNLPDWKLHSFQWRRRRQKASDMKMEALSALKIRQYRKKRANMETGSLKFEYRVVNSAKLAFEVASPDLIYFDRFEILKFSRFDANKTAQHVESPVSILEIIICEIYDVFACDRYRQNIFQRRC